MPHPSPESSPSLPREETSPIPPPSPDSRSFALTPERLASKQQEWKDLGFSQPVIEELTTLLTEHTAITDHLKTFKAKGDQYYKDNPEAKQELDNATTQAIQDKERIATRRQQLYDQLAEEKRLAGGEPNLPPAPTPDTSPRPHATPEQLHMAKEVMGTDYLGPEAVTTTWNVTLKVEQIPQIPFSRAELERAKELGQMLILRIDHTADGKPLTMQKMEELMQPKMDAVPSGKVLFSLDWYKNEEFFTTDTPQPRWALVSKDTIPNSTSQNYLDQTQTMVTYLTTHVFNNQPIPSPYKEAIEEFEKEKASIKAIPESDWELVAERLAQLQITQLTRALPVEVLYDLLTVFQTTGVRLYKNRYIWTSRRSTDGGLVGVGDFGETGAHVNCWEPGSAHDVLGGSLSRSH